MSDTANNAFSISNEIMAVETCSLRAVKCSTNKIELLYLMYAKETEMLKYLPKGMGTSEGADQGASPSLGTAG